MKLFKTGFPVRFRTNEIPSDGIMEFKFNNTWKRLCTPSWDDKEKDLTCRTMGYNGPTGNNSQPESKGHLNKTTGENCTSLLFNCNNSSKQDLQSCAGS